MSKIIDMTRPIDVICMGRVAVDLYAEQIGTPLSKAQTFRKYLGGCAGNIAVGCARQGLRSAMLSCVGEDEMGTFLIDTLLDEKVDITMVRQTPNHLTGLVLLGIIPPDHFPLIFYRENCADMQIQCDDIDETFFQKTKSLLITGTGFSTESMRKTSHHALSVAKKTQTAVIFDLDYRPVLWGLQQKGNGETRFCENDMVTSCYQTVLPHCDLIVGTEEEILIAGNQKEVLSSIEVIREFTDGPIVLKRGAKGCEIYLPSQQKPLTSTLYSVEVLNVLGAGDAFMSGFLRGFLRNEPFSKCMQYGNACGAIVVTRHGCSFATPNFDEMKDFIERRKE